MDNSNDAMFPLFDQPFDAIFPNEFDVGLDDIFNETNDPFNLFPDDNQISNVLSDDFLRMSDAIFTSELMSTCPVPSSKTKKPKAKTIRINAAAAAAAKSASPASGFKSLLGNSPAKAGPKSTVSPKVYISKSNKQSSHSSKRAGTSILVKKADTKPNKKSTSILKSKCDLNGQLNHNNNAYNVLFDHDYCGGGFVIQPKPTVHKDDKDKKDAFIKNESCLFAKTNQQTENMNNLVDFLDDFIPDDVMLNELPNCLSGLMGLGCLSMNSGDILEGLNDACNLMEDQFIDSLSFNVGQEALPDLNITEDDINKIIQADNMFNDFECETQDGKTSSANGDNFESLSSVGGYTEESSSEDSVCGSNEKIKAAFANGNKLKRNRSLSSSALNGNRKRRFSSRSSVASSTNSSGESSCESSSAESVISSRSSSPERCEHFAASFASFAMPRGSKFHLKINKARLRGNVEKMNRFITFRDLSKTDLVDRRRKDESAGGGNGSRRDGKMVAQSKPGVKINENVLYIGDIANGTTKANIYNWFAKYGTIEDVQIYFCEHSKNYAFVTYRFSGETKKAIKHANKDLGKPFKLSYGRRRNRTYRDRDLMGDSHLDFRLEANDFDTLMRTFNI